MTTEVGGLNVQPGDEEASGLSAGVAFPDSSANGTLGVLENGQVEVTITNHANETTMGGEVWG